MEVTMYTDRQGRTWHIMERDGGSICVYYTIPGAVAHFVVYDTLDSNERKPIVLQKSLNPRTDSPAGERRA